MKATGQGREIFSMATNEEIVFTRKATEAINLVASAGAAEHQAGTKIVLSIMEHHPISCPGISQERHGARHQMGAGR